MNTGQPERYGRWTVLKHGRAWFDGKTRRACECRCDCGVVAVVPYRRLQIGRSKSCGCRRKDNLRTRWPLGHGHALAKQQSKTYSSWKAMKKRCYCSNHVAYKNYGGRGISVCERWLRSFVSFLADMGERPDGMTLDRKETTATTSLATVAGLLLLNRSRIDVDCQKRRRQSCLRSGSDHYDDPRTASSGSRIPPGCYFEPI